jgi:hypothetical protein
MNGIADQVTMQTLDLEKYMNRIRTDYNVNERIFYKTLEKPQVDPLEEEKKQMELMLHPNTITPELLLIQESPLNYYYHEVDAPFHARSNSRVLWDKIASKRNKE